MCADTPISPNSSRYHLQLFVCVSAPSVILYSPSSACSRGQSVLFVCVARDVARRPRPAAMAVTLDCTRHPIDSDSRGGRDSAVAVVVSGQSPRALNGGQTQVVLRSHCILNV